MLIFYAKTPIFQFKSTIFCDTITNNTLNDRVLSLLFFSLSEWLNPLQSRHFLTNSKKIKMATFFVYGVWFVTCTLRQTLAEFGINIFNALNCQSRWNVIITVFICTIEPKALKLFLICTNKMFSVACKKFQKVGQLQKFTTPNTLIAIRNCSVVDNSSGNEGKYYDFG